MNNLFKYEQIDNQGWLVQQPEIKKMSIERLRELRNKIITGSFMIGDNGLKEPPNWQHYALSLEEYIFEETNIDAQPASVEGEASQREEESRVDLKKLQEQFDKMFARETDESLREWFESKAETYKNLLIEIDKSLYIGKDLDDTEILKWYIDVVTTIKDEIKEVLADTSFNSDAVEFANFIGDRPLPEYSKSMNKWRWWNNSERNYNYATTQELYNIFKESKH